MRQAAVASAAAAGAVALGKPLAGALDGLPGEHGFRFLPGFYLNLSDTMRRIPTADGTVYDRLVRASTYRTSFAGRPDFTAPLSFPPEGVTPETFVESLTAALVEAYTPPPHEALYVNYVNSPFALTSIGQAQFWTRDLSRNGDGTVRESFSTIISDWDTPGILYGKGAKDLSPPEIAQEAFAQIQAHLNDDGRALRRDDMLHSWFLDPAIRPRAASGPGVENDTPLFIQDPGEWANRPESVTAIPNLFLAGDWVRTHINVTTMDGANQGGRQAANGVLAAAGSSEQHARLWPLYEPPEYQPYKMADRIGYEQGLPNMFDPQAAPPR